MLAKHSGNEFWEFSDHASIDISRVFPKFVSALIFVYLRFTTASTSRSTLTASQVCQLLCDESGNEIDAASDIEIQVFISDLVSSLASLRNT